MSQAVGNKLQKLELFWLSGWLRTVLLAPGGANNLEGNSFSSIIKTCSSLMLALLVTSISLVCGQSEMLFLVQCMRSSDSLGCSDDCQRGRHKNHRAWSVQWATDLWSFNSRWTYLVECGVWCDHEIFEKWMSGWGLGSLKLSNIHRCLLSLAIVFSPRACSFVFQSP